MDETEFKPGDLVRVKSGGPIMTIEQVAQKDTFAPVVLERAEKPRAAFSVGVVRA